MKATRRLLRIALATGLAWGIDHGATPVAASALAGSTRTDRPVRSCEIFHLSKKELTNLEAKAAKGDAEASFRIYLYCAAFVHDRALSSQWLKRAVELGHPIASYNLACELEQAQPPDYSTAFRLYSKCANQGDVHAMRALGRMWEEGHGVAKDKTIAMHWYEKSARAGQVFSMEHLAEGLRDNGKLYEAYIWAKLVAIRFCRFPKQLAQTNPDDLYKGLTPEQQAKATATAAKLDAEIPQLEFPEW